ncbi:MAG: glycoside hydrolase 43 family protein [Bacteroidota bacterium]|nr:glycoside hydrolase 43 family protein [Bacteroidota bacterium]
MTKTLLTGMFFFMISQCLSGQTDKVGDKWGYWQNWGDTGNGFYHNPLIPADYSDIDCIRVGTVYYAISSTFQYSPGLVILVSKDLVNWRILGHVVKDLRQISPEMNWDKMNRYGKGIWAGAIRYHAHKFWIYFGTPDEGYFMSTAKNAGGPWAPLHCVLPQKGWDDCCPFWDNDGQAYLIGTHFSENYKVHLFKMTTDGKQLIKGTDCVIHQSKGSEANKLYKINGTYYHLFSEVRNNGRALMMERSKTLYGPYKAAKQLSYTQPDVNEPNQGGLVQTQNGDWFFLTHHGTGDWSGRVISLLPVNWLNGWPMIGKVTPPEQMGKMAWSGKMPFVTADRAIYQTSDEFNLPELQPQWEWNYQPRDDKWSLSNRKGWLRLKAFKTITAGGLLKAGNTLTQRSLRTKTNEVIIRLDVSGMANGQKAGLAHFGAPDYAAFGISCKGAAKQLEFIKNGLVEEGEIFSGKEIWLKSRWGLDGKSRFYFSPDGSNYRPFGRVYQMAWESYRGDRIAIYSYNELSDAGYIDVDFFHYNYTKN